MKIQITQSAAVLWTGDGRRIEFPTEDELLEWLKENG